MENSILPAEGGAGRAGSNIFGIRSAISTHPELSGLIAYDEFTRTLQRVKPCSWKQSVGQWDREDDLRVTEALQRNDAPAIPSVVQAALYLEAMDNKRDMLSEYVRSLKWDREPRLDSWTSMYLGAASSEYVRSVGRKFLISAIARALRPGAKADSMLVLQGPGGIGKSAAVAVLAGEGRFTDQMPDLDKKDACIQLLGRWIVEFSELTALKRASQGERKAFLSRCSDVFRAPYATHAVEHPRRCVFVGTTNESEFLDDPTGARRFWTIECGVIDLEALRRDVDQLWAEAFIAYSDGEIWHLTAAEETLAASEQAKHYLEDPWAPYIDAYVCAHDKVLTQTILEQAIGLSRDKIDQGARRRVNRHLRKNGWGERKSGSNRVWHRPSAIPEQVAFAPKETSWVEFQQVLQADPSPDRRMD